MQRDFAEHLASWAEPLLTYSEQVAGAVKGLIHAAIPPFDAPPPPPGKESP